MQHRKRPTRRLIAMVAATAFVTLPAAVMTAHVASATVLDTDHDGIPNRLDRDVDWSEVAGVTRSRRWRRRR